MNFARFNHVLVPQSAEERMAWLNSGRHKWLGGSYRLYLALTPVGRGLLLFWLFAGALGLNVAEFVVYILWSVITGLIAASLLFRRWYSLPRVQLKIEIPHRVRAGAPLSLSALLVNSGTTVRDVRIQWPFLTWDGKYKSQPDAVSTIVGGGQVQSSAVMTFSARGVHSLMPTMAMRVLPLGIACGPAIQSSIAEILVLPQVPTVHRLELPLRERCHPGGVPMVAHTGEAMELAGVRPYQRGDRARDLHARTWARVGVPHVRMYQQEFFTRMGIVLDIHQHGLREARFEGAVSLAAGILAYLSGRDALVDIVCTGNHIHNLTIGRSLGFFQQGLDLLATVTPGAPLEPDVLTAELVRHMDRLSGVFVITSHLNDKVLAMRAFCEHRQIPVRVLVVTAKPSAEGFPPGITSVPLEALNNDSGVWL